MDLNVSTVLSFNPETKVLFDRLHDDARRLSGDIERLQRFMERTIADEPAAPASNPVAKERDLDSWLQEDKWQKADILSASVADSAPAPEPSTPAPVERDAGARKVLEEEADAAARAMVLSFQLMAVQGQSTTTSLAAALRVMREASAGFECPQTMGAILRVLDGMDAAAREEQSNG